MVVDGWGCLMVGIYAGGWSGGCRIITIYDDAIRMGLLDGAIFM